MNFLASNIRDPELVCRTEYLTLRRACRRSGLDPSEIDKSRRELSEVANGLCFLKKSAYKPTGVALGAPLPVKCWQRHLWRLTRLVAEYISRISPWQSSPFAFVPADWYHITVVNRTHFEISDMIKPMTEGEHQEVTDFIIHGQPGAITIHIHGLLLTRSGRLIAVGSPYENRLYQLRSDLATLLPQMSVGLSKIAHIKLGHVLTPLPWPQLAQVLSFVSRCGEHVNARLAFQDLYTPQGRIGLGGFDEAT